GDSVLSVADDFGVPPEKLRSWNRMKGNDLKRGRVLRIYRPVPGGRSAQNASGKAAKSSGAGKSHATKSNGKQVHKVQPGDTLYSIANAYNTTVAALQRDNGLKSSKLMPGDTLVISSGH
ncbi:MAG: LysM peptidoglycan-binding domain-containing protein, partial [Terriglobales bacterium]